MLPPSQVSQPMVQPTLNHRHVCADSQGLVPFRHAQGQSPYGSHLYGAFPPLHSGVGVHYSAATW